MDKLFSPMRRDGITTPKKDKARTENGLENQTNLTPDYTATKPKKLNVTRLAKAGSGTEPANEPQAVIDGQWKEKLAALVDEFNRRYANVRYADKQMIMRFTNPDENINQCSSFDFMGQHAFMNLHQNTSIKVYEKVTRGETESVYATHAKAWLSHFKCRVYLDGVVFRPLPYGAKLLPDSYFNTWQGLAVEPKAGDWLLIKKHLLEVICNHETPLYDYIIKWIAYKIQNPHKQAGSAVVLRGKKGSGKGTLGHFLKRLYGSHGKHISNSEHLTGKFNAHLADCCFLFADEAFFSGDKRGENALKALITEPTLIIERKGFDAIEQQNYLQILMATNEQWAIPASTDERRYCVVDVPDTKIGDRDYFKALHAAMEQADVIAAFLHDMLCLDINGWHSGDIPETDALKEQRLHSLDSVGKFLVDGYLRQVFSTDRFDSLTAWCESINASYFYNSYLAYANRAKLSQYDIATQTTFGKKITQEAKLFKKRDGAGRQCYYLGTMDDFKAALEERYRIKIDD